MEEVAMMGGYADVLFPRHHKVPVLVEVVSEFVDLYWVKLLKSMSLGDAKGL